MEEVKSLQMNVIKYTSIFIGVLSILVLFTFQLEGVKYILSLVLGGGISVLTFMLLANTVVKASFMEPGKAQVYMASQYFVRFTIMALVLYISTQKTYLNVFATAIGIFTVKGILYFIQFKDKRKQSNQNLKRKEE